MKIIKNNFLLDISSLFSSRILGLGISIIASILLTRLLGPENKGIITTILVIPGIIISFSDLGLRQAIIYFMGKKIFEDKKIFSTISFLFLITSLLSLLIAIVSFFVGDYFNKYSLSLLIFPLLLIPIKLYQNYTSGVLYGKKKINNLSISNIISDIIYLFFVLIIYLIPKNNQLQVALFAHVVSPLIASFYIFSIIRKFGSLKPHIIPGLPWIFLKKGFIYAIALFILSLNYRVDIIILERLTSPYEVGIYSVGVNIADLLWLLPTALTAVNFSYSANATDPMEYAKKTAKILRISLWIGILPALLLFFLAPFFIPFFYGQEFQSSGTVVQAILPGVWMTLIFKILNSDLAGRGIPQAALWVYLFAVILNIILNIWWDPIFGAKGAAWASTVSYSVGAIIFLFTYSRISNVSISDLIIIQKKDIYGFIKV